MSTPNTIFARFKWLIIVASIIFAIIIWASIFIKAVETDAGFETVLIHKPYFFGKEGVADMPLSSGRKYIWTSTDYMKVETRAIQHEEPFDDMTTSDNIYVDFHSFIRISIKAGGTPYLIKKFGADWYKNNVQQPFRTLVRNNVSKHDMMALSVRSTALDSVQQHVEDGMRALVEKTGLPIIIEEVNFGKVLPNENVLAELNRTAEQQQRKNTENNKAEAEIARKTAETKRAEADNAYRNALNLSPEQFVQLRMFESMVEASKSGANVFFNAPGITVGNK